MGNARVGWYGDNAGARRLAQVSAAAFGCLLLANCSQSTKLARGGIDPKYGVSASPRVVEPGQPVPKGGGVYRVGRPYTVAGQTYIPEENRRYRNEGLASWYGDDFHGRLTANGEVYDMHAISAAHPTMPMPSYARVTNMRTNRSIIVRVNDRGPYHANREIDVSSKAAELLGFRGHGVAKVRVEYVGPAPLAGTDDRQLMATLRENGEPAPAPSGVMVASARPFLPNMSGRASVRDDMPVPQARPFDLGQADRVAVAEAYQGPRMRTVEARAYPPASDVTSATRPRWQSEPPLVQAPATQPATPQQAVSPVSAYAPMRYDGSQAVSTGRGLY